MSELLVFSNPEFGKVRTISDGDKVLFCGSDVAKALGYAKPQNAIAAHCKGALKRGILTNGGEQQMLFIPEGDIYRLAARSELPSAEKFESWIFDEVLPSIRKHGAYMTPDTIDKMIASPEFGIKLLTALQEERQKVNVLQAENSALTVKTAIMAPKAEYFDALVDRESLLSIRETAKALGIGERQLVSELLERKYLYRDKKGKLLPYAEKNRDYFEVKECTNDKTGWCGAQTLVTVKGREMILKWGMS